MTVPETSGGIASPESFRPAFLATVCDHWIRCGRIEPSARDRCLLGPGEGSGKLEVAWQAVGFLHAAEQDREAALGRYRFDAARAAECLRAAAGESCRAEPPRSCENLARAYWAPAVAKGGACRRTDSCLDGFCDATQGAEGRCSPFLGRGDVCHTGDACGPHATCEWADTKRGEEERGKCVALAREGESCLSSGWCDDHLACLEIVAGGKGVCRPLPREGESCMTIAENVDCASGLFCDLASLMPTCKKPLHAGAACAQPDACEEQLHCAGLVPDDQPVLGPPLVRVRAAGRCTPPPG